MQVQEESFEEKYLKNLYEQNSILKVMCEQSAKRLKLDEERVEREKQILIIMKEKFEIKIKSI